MDPDLGRVIEHYTGLGDDDLAAAYEAGPGTYRSAEVWGAIEGEFHRRKLNISRTTDALKSPGASPWTLTTAAALLGLYGLATLVSGFALSQSRWPSPVSYLETGVRSAGLLALAAGLWLRERWVWWAAVAITTFLGVVSFFIWGIGFIRGTIGTALPPSFIPYVLGGKLFFVFILALLLTPSARRSFRQPAA